MVVVYHIGVQQVEYAKYMNTAVQYALQDLDNSYLYHKRNVEPVQVKVLEKITANIIQWYCYI